VNTTTTTTTPDETSPFNQPVTTINPFYSTTESSRVRVSAPKTTVITGHKPMVSQGHVNEFKGGPRSQTDVSTNSAGLPFNLQSGQLVTNMSVSLSNTPFINRPISSIGVANCDGISHDNLAPMLCRGKEPPIDSFTGEDIFDDWLLTLEQAAIWYGWTPDETLMQLSGHLRGRASQEYMAVAFTRE